jgi:hypothetical protein
MIVCPWTCELTYCLLLNTSHGISELVVPLKAGCEKGANHDPERGTLQTPCFVVKEEDRVEGDKSKPRKIRGLHQENQGSTYFPYCA